MTFLSKEIIEIEGGCRIIFNIQGYEFVCNDFHICPTCQAKVETLKLAQQKHNEEVKELLEKIKTKLGLVPTDPNYDLAREEIAKVIDKIGEQK